MQSPKLVLFPTTHEQSLPSFHVQSALLDEFLKHLAASGVKLGEPPRSLRDSGSEKEGLMEILVEEGTSLDKLEQIKAQFLSEH